MNKQIMIGRLGRDPEVRYTSDGKAVCNLSVATDVGFGANKSTTWFSVTVWGKQAESAGKYLQKGREVYVEGEMRTREYQAKDGTTKTAWEVHADRWRFVGGKGGDAGSGVGWTDTAGAESVPF